MLANNDESPRMLTRHVDFAKIIILHKTLARIYRNNDTHIGQAGNNDTSEYEYYTDDYDFPNACLEIDCIWDRTRKSRIHILHPLTFILSLIGLLGIVGNIFVILVFSRTIQKRTSTYLVLMLAIIDLIACSVVIPGTLLKEWLFEFKSDLVCKLWELMRNFAIISSAMILAAIAFDRFLLVYRRNAQDGSKHVTMAMILFTVLTGIALGVPPMLGVGVYMEYIDGGEVYVKICLTNYQLISDKSLNIYWQIITALFSILIFTIIVLYMLIFLMVYKHSARVKGHNKLISSHTRLTSLQTKQKFLTSVLPFIGFSKTQNSVNPRPKNNKKPNLWSSWNPGKKIRRLFKNKVSQGGDNKNIIMIKVIGNSTTSNDSAIDGDMNSDCQPEPGPSQPLNSYRSHDILSKNPPQLLTNQNQLSPNLTNQKQGIQTSADQRLQDLTMRNRSAHIKTTKVLCIITVVYIIAFLPMFLITHRAMEQNMVAFYLYFINNAANPIIYSFMNRKFRQDVWKMCSCRKNTVWVG